MSKTIFQEIHDIKNTENSNLIWGLPIVCELQLRGLRKVVPLLKKPFDEGISNLLEKTACRIMENFPGCIIAHIFSNEITFVIQCAKRSSDPQKIPAKPDNRRTKSKFTDKMTILAGAFFNEEKKNAKNLPKEVLEPIYRFEANCWNVDQTITTINWLMAKETKAKHISAVKICTQLGIESEDKSTKALIDALAEEGIIFEKNYKDKEFIYRGVFLKKRKLNEKDRIIERLNIPYIHQIYNKLGVFFGNEQAQLIEPNKESKKKE